MEVVIKDVVKIENEGFYIFEDELGEEYCVNANGRKMYTLKIQEPNRKSLSIIQYLTRESLSVEDKVEIN